MILQQHARQICNRLAQPYHFLFIGSARLGFRLRRLQQLELARRAAYRRSKVARPSIAGSRLAQLKWRRFYCAIGGHETLARQSSGL